MYKVRHILQHPLFGAVDFSKRPKNHPYRATANYRGQYLNAVDNALGGGIFRHVKVSADDVTGQGISSIVYDADTKTAEITTASAHGLGIGRLVRLSATVPEGYRGEHEVISTASSTKFTIRTNSAVSGDATTVGAYIASAIGKGHLVEFTSETVDGKLDLYAQLSTATANSGRSLGIAYTSAFAGERLYVQIAGLAQALTTGSVSANAPVYYGANSTVQSGAVADKHIVGAQFISTKGAEITIAQDENMYERAEYRQPTEDFVLQLDSDKSIIDLSYPHVQGQASAGAI